MTNPSTDSPLNAEEWRDRFVVFVETVLDLCASDSRYRSQVADLRLQLRELAREPLAAHPESRPDPGEGRIAALERALNDGAIGAMRYAARRLAAIEGERKTANDLWADADKLEAILLAEPEPFMDELGRRSR